MLSTAIELTCVAKSFGDVEALGHIDLSIEAGEIVTLIGPSGSGKTTLLRIIAGLETPTRGQVCIFGKPPDQARQANQIGMVPQAPGLLPWRTVAANATLLIDLNSAANPATAIDPTDLLQDVGLGDFLQAYPHELSGGMQQRVALVRAFALGAPLLLLDEPFAALDEITRAEMRHLLARLCRRRPVSVFFVTHSIPEAVYLSDRVGVLSQRPALLIDVQTIGFSRPRSPDIEDDPAFFDHVTGLRAALRNEATS